MSGRGPGPPPGPTNTGAPSPIDYTWLPYPFTSDSAGPTALPGGPFQVVEDNTLASSDPLDPHFIDEDWIQTGTPDASNDANVATTRDPHWCVNMTAQNNNGVTGPVHMYAHFPEGSADTAAGLIIWNGLNLDALNGDEQVNMSDGALHGLRKIWLQELEQPFSPSGLPCGVRAAAIELTPLSAVNELPKDKEHRLTATVRDSRGFPIEGVVVTFTILTGPNAGDTSAKGDHCLPKPQKKGPKCATGADGQVHWTYKGDKVGTDTIQACFGSGDNQSCSNEVTKQWVKDKPVKIKVGRMHGHGKLIANGKLHYEIDLHCDPTKKKDKLHVHWNKHKFELQVADVTCTDDPAITPEKGFGFDTVTGAGTGKWDKQQNATISFKFTDEGKGNKNVDFAAFEIKVNGATVLMASGRLPHVHHHTHPEKVNKTSAPHRSSRDGR